MLLLLLLLLSRFSHVWLCATPKMAAYQAPPSLRFSRQEHWSGLQFPSPMHESEKWKWSRSVVSDSATPWTAAYQAPPSMGFSRQEYCSGVPLPNRMHCISFKTVWRFSYILKRNANQDRSRQEWRERSMCTRNSALSYATFLNFTLMEWNDLPYTFSWLWKLMST